MPKSRIEIKKVKFLGHDLDVEFMDGQPVQIVLHHQLWSVKTGSRKPGYLGLTDKQAVKIIKKAQDYNYPDLTAGS